MSSLVSLNAQEQELATQYTSEAYGIVWGQEHIDTLAFLSYMSKLYEDYLPNAQQSDLANIFLHIGHWNLLLNNFPKALSSYSVALRKNPELLNDPLFLFGIGLSHFYYGAFNRCLDVFQRLITICPSFPRKADILLRIALVLKHYGAYDLSEKYYRMIINSDRESNPIYCSLSRSEIFLSWAHLYQIKGNYAEAKSIFENVIKSQFAVPDINPALRLRFMKQITSLLDNLSDEEAQSFPECSIVLINEMMNTQAESPMIFYYAGRCLAIANRVNEAFFKYRNCVDRMQNGADVWCSIGNLYQHQNQLTDALQAYVCSLQIETDHFESWINVGILYESVNQIKDAISSYVQACNHCKDDNFKTTLTKRIDILKAFQSRRDVVVSRDVLPGIGPSGHPGSSSATFRQRPNNDNSREIRCPFDKQTIQTIKSLVENRCSQVQSLGCLSLLPVDSLLPYVRRPFETNKTVPIFFEEAASTSILDSSENEAHPAVLFRQADVNNINLLIPNQSVMWFQYGQVFRIRLHCASTGQLILHIPNQCCTIVTHATTLSKDKAEERPLSFRIAYKKTISSVLQFARYQASTCVRMTSNDELPDEVSFAWINPVPVNIETFLFKSMPPCLRPDQANNLLSYAYPYGKPSIYLLVPGNRLPIQLKPYTIVYLNIGPGEIHWNVMQTNSVIVSQINEQMRNLMGVDCHDGTDDIWLNSNKLKGYSSAVIQRSGDLLIVAANAIHWSTSLGWTNCLRWCLADFSEFQSISIDYQLGTVRARTTPNLPLHRMSLSLARECLITNCAMHEAVLSILKEYRQNIQGVDDSSNNMLRCSFCESVLLWSTHFGTTTSNKHGAICETCRKLYPNAELPWWSDIDDTIDRFRLYIPILNFYD
ncbi:hypothetical protein GJ496_002598 [Pomphorhynchus laevis]|nr:hypothetical protein GJ496_002598 [Pomphorhynchus laevis]